MDSDIIFTTHSQIIQPRGKKKAQREGQWEAGCSSTCVLVLPALRRETRPRPP